MTGRLTTEVAALLDNALRIYGNDPAASAALSEYRSRLREPLRVAIAGMVKAGKSTLLNALIGEEIAATDAGECTRIVTWYRYGDTPRVTLHARNGSSRPLRIRRVSGRLEFGLDGTPADEVERLVVDWPTGRLRELTVIDTPGTASLSTDVSGRSTRFLLPEGAPSDADAVLYLMRHLHGEDLDFLQAFRAAATGGSASNALAVLSRADEVGAGRIDSLLSARDISRRYRTDADLGPLVAGVVPVAGLVAQAARTLRQSEFALLAELARLPRVERERMLLSADRFVSPGASATTGSEARAALLARFGLFGIRLATVLIRGGVRDAPALAEELGRRSGLDELLRLLSEQFGSRAEVLKARTALTGLELLLRSAPRPGSEVLEEALEKVTAEAHEFREIDVLVGPELRSGELAPEIVAEAERLLGARGDAAAMRLGLPADAAPHQVRDEATASLARWRAKAEHPLTTRSTRDVSRAVARCCERILVAARQSGERETVRLRPEPAARARE